jgi:Protein of unknown function (DUF4236)
VSWQFRKSFTVIPGVKLNLTSRGLSTTIGAAPFSLNIGPNGAYRNISIPGTGIRNRERIDTPGANRSVPDVAPVLRLDMNPVHEVRSANTNDLTSNSLEPMRELLAKAFAQREELRTELATATSDYNRARERFRKWDEGWLFKKVFTGYFADRKEKAETAEAKQKELQEQFDLSAIKAEINLEPDQQGPYLRLVEKFKAVSECGTIWNILSERRVNRMTERSNCDHSVDRTVVRFAIDGCDLIQWDQKVPHLRNKTGGDMFIYPGFVLYRDATEAFALIDFQDIELRYVRTQFTETEPIPADSQTIGYTWAKCNKDGTPDRRFRDNYQIPLTLYGGLNFHTSDGLDVRYLCSNPTAAQEFVQAWMMFRSTFRMSQPPKKTEVAAKLAAPSSVPAPVHEVVAPQNANADWIGMLTRNGEAFQHFADLSTDLGQKIEGGYTAAANGGHANFAITGDDVNRYLEALTTQLGLDAELIDNSEFVSFAVRHSFALTLKDVQDAVDTFIAKANTGHMNISDIMALIHSGVEFAKAHGSFSECTTQTPA